MRKSLQTNKKLNQLEDTQPHQMNYQLGQEDHNVVDKPPVHYGNYITHCLYYFATNFL